MKLDDYLLECEALSSSATQFLGSETREYKADNATNEEGYNNAVSIASAYNEWANAVKALQRVVYRARILQESSNRDLRKIGKILENGVSRDLKVKKENG